MLLTSILFYHIWFLTICILDLSVYCKIKSILLFSFQKKKKTFAWNDGIKYFKDLLQYLKIIIIKTVFENTFQFFDKYY